MTRSHQPADRAKAIGLALAVGAVNASDATGIPRRTISSWLSGERPAPELDAALAASRDDVVAKLWEAVSAGTAAVLDGLRDPRARLGDKAQALRVVSEQYALLTGRATERSETFTYAEHRDVTAPSEDQQRRRDAIRAAVLSVLDENADPHAAAADAWQLADGIPELGDPLDVAEDVYMAVLARQTRPPDPDLGQPVRRLLADSNGIIR